MNRFWIQIIAIVTMTIDHFAMIFLPYGSEAYEVLRNIGRVAFPLFCFLMGEGIRHTRNKWKYLFRVLTIGLVIELFYYILKIVMPEYSNQITDTNIFITLAFGLLISILLLSEKIYVKFIAIIPILLAVLFEYKYHFVMVFDTKVCLTFEYGIYGVILVVLFCLLKKPVWQSIAFILLTSFMYKPAVFDQLNIKPLVMSGLGEHYSMFITPVFFLYNGKNGPKLKKWFTYFYYPAHLLIFYVIDMFI